MAKMKTDQFKILIVDDEPMALQTIDQLLVSLGFFIDSACNGENALIKLNETKFDLIISDLVMPVMDGLSLLNEVRMRFTQPLPFILMSGEQMSGEQMCVKIPNNRTTFFKGDENIYFLIKPFYRDLLITIVNYIFIYQQRKNPATIQETIDILNEILPEHVKSEIVSDSGSFIGFGCPNLLSNIFNFENEDSRLIMALKPLVPIEYREYFKPTDRYRPNSSTMRHACDIIIQKYLEELQGN